MYHSLLLKYCLKRQRFSYIRMQAHIELTILDHNYNTNRKQAIKKKAMLTLRSLVFEGIKYMQNKNTLGAKKCKANQKQQLNISFTCNQKV